MRCLLLILAMLVIGCADLTKPSSGNSARGGTSLNPSPVGKPTAAEPVETAPQNPKERRIREEKELRIGAAHVLIAYAGSRRAKPDIKRTKREAKKRAQEVRDKARAGSNFAELARQYSDGPSAGKGGALGSFGRKSMVKPFADAAFALKVGEVSDVVETDFGFHVIKRTR